MTLSNVAVSELLSKNVPTDTQQVILGTIFTDYIAQPKVLKHCFGSIKAQSHKKLALKRQRKENNKNFTII